MQLLYKKYLIIFSNTINTSIAVLTFFNTFKIKTIISKMYCKSPAASLFVGLLSLVIGSTDSSF